MLVLVGLLGMLHLCVRSILAALVVEHGNVLVESNRCRWHLVLFREWTRGLVLHLGALLGRRGVEVLALELAFLELGDERAILILDLLAFGEGQVVGVLSIAQVRHIGLLHRRLLDEVILRLGAATLLGGALDLVLAAVHLLSGVAREALPQRTRHS